MKRTGIDDWRGWRGDGSGVAPGSDLPTAWGPADNVAWKAAIPGEGISSPIVSGDAVWVTAAVPASPLLSPTAFVAIVAVLVAIAGIAIARRGRAGGAPSLLVRVDRFVAIAALLGLVAGVVAMLAKPELVPPGNFARTWRVTGLVGVCGLVAATGMLAPGCPLRLVSALVLAACAALYHVFAPSGYTQPIPLNELLVTSAPLAVAALGFAVLFVVARGRPSSVRSGWATLGWGVLLGATALAFAYPNFLRDSAGLDRVLLCLDRATGAVRWQCTGFTAPADKKYKTNSYATPTPVTDGRSVVASYGPGLFCADADGTVRWRRMEPAYARFQRYGAASSPVIVDDVVVYAFMPEWPGSADAGDIERHGHLTALDLATGEVRWTVRPRGARESYTTPLVVPIGGRTAVVFVSWNACTAFDARSGEEIWTCRIPIDQCVPSPVRDADTVYAIGGTHGPCAAVAIGIDGTGDVTDTHVRWTMKRGIPQCPSAVLYDGLIYMVHDGGVLTCLDAKDGSVVYKKRLGNRYQGSAVAGDGKVYFVAIDGETTIVRAGRTFDPIGKPTIAESVYSSPAIAGRQLFLRGDRHLYCIGTQ